MNQIILLGRLTKDPEVRYTPNGKVVAQFTLAVDRPYANQAGQKEADFIPVVIWGKSAETVGNYLSRGQRALVEGRLQIRSYQAKDGTNRYVTEVIADRFEFIERKNQNGATTQAPQKAPQQSSQPVSRQPEQQSAFDDMGAAVPFDQEIPF